MNLTVSHEPRVGYKAKTIRAVLKKKLDDWSSSIDDPAVRDLVKRDAIVTGGSIASMLLGEKINDFDVYFKTKETTKAVAEYYVEKFKEQGSKVSFKNQPNREVEICVTDKNDQIRVMVKSVGAASENGSDSYEYFEQVPAEGAAGEFLDSLTGEDPAKALGALEDMNETLNGADKGKARYRPVFLTSNAITLSHDIQIVIRFYGNLDEIHKNYDFVHCTNGYDYGTGELYLRQEALEALLARELRYIGSKYPLCSVIRTRKFIERGWRINAGQYLKMLMQVSQMDLCDMTVLEDQLTGVDAAYFHQIIAYMRDRNKDKPAEERDRIDSMYLVEIIDRIF